ncbi:cell division protein FtsQ/DivIB [Thiomonas bhubaneswarensis]|uniref:Cell division protein FtsQ n=1 Tax=Thiomonas bhubaneswarensis TaxID=339866 RepID=A0A0K6HY75_9BURK|nr:cell division protein FtsQ/DivIB [Thiomonas bhubaneswarensis]CUA95781.1 Cell division septal protein FtsQ [Thiomonas bhubaneswarensis]
MSSTAAHELPLDIRLMQGTSRALIWLFALGCVVAAGHWLMQRNWWDIRAVQLQGDLQRISPVTVRAEALPKLQGNFLTINLAQAQRVFEDVPWVRTAVVQRLWPMRLAVTLQAQQPVALWHEPGGATQLVNAEGQTFSANIGEVQGLGLPQFSGPAGTSAQVLQMSQTLQPLLARAHQTLTTLDLGSGGNWRVQTRSGLRIDLGSAPDSAATQTRLTQFLALMPQLETRYGRAIDSADLRYPNGFAVHLQGVDLPGMNPTTNKTTTPRPAGRKD